ncbi:hypothetical protein [Actinomadura sp. 3N407]|uniref:hypothetical protein n=1 Tax=Actinomadura sp. 3N407 TaxID=3457423 RepID=UPI003FCCCF4E
MRPTPKPTDYLFAIRTPGSPPAPEGVTTVTLARPGGDVISSVLEGLRASGLAVADFRSRVIFMAAGVPDCVVTYAALCGFSGRRIDAYADGAVLELSRIDSAGAALPDAGPPSDLLALAQVGGPAPDGMPTVRLGSAGRGPLSRHAATVIRYAARLRMVPPESPRDALAMFVLVAALRRRGTDRFPFLSTGTEPVDDEAPDQGIDLERTRREAVRLRQEQRTARGGHEVVPPEPVSPHDRRIAQADAVDVRTVLSRLGSSAEDGQGLRCCPRPRRHADGDGRPSMKVHEDNRTRCARCDTEKIGPVRLAADALGVTPDEAASFILWTPIARPAPVPPG